MNYSPLLLLLILMMIGSCFAADKPNFIIILTDDQGWGDLGVQGHKTLKTPHLDKMAAEGARLTSFYAANICTPSRAQIQTGCYSQRVGLARGSRHAVLLDNDIHGLNPKETTIAEVLKKADYKTGYVGKWHLGDNVQFLPHNQGYDEFYGLPYSHDINSKNQKRVFEPLPVYENDKVLETDPDPTTLTEKFTARALDFIDRSSDSPFFLFLSQPMPHRPCDASAKYREKYTKEQLAKVDTGNTKTADFLYPAAISEIDEGVGRIIAKLAELKITEKTVVIFMSDNGPSVGSSGGLKGTKGTFYDGGIRVPFLIKAPGRISPGLVCKKSYTEMDLLPTIASWAEIPLEHKVDGLDISKWLNEQEETPVRPILHFTQGRPQVVTYGSWKLHLKGKKLYNMEKNLRENNNVASKNPEILQSILKEIAPLLKELGTHQKKGPGCREVGKVSE